MPTWLKVIVIIVAVFVLVFVAAGFFTYRWVQSHAGELKAEGEKITAEATAFGRDKDPSACVDETLARLGRCDGIICEAKTKIFLTKCVAASNVPEGFCASIPKRTEFMASAQWAFAECARRGHQNDQRCARTISGLQDYCERR